MLMCSFSYVFRMYFNDGNTSENEHIDMEVVLLMQVSRTSSGNDLKNKILFYECRASDASRLYF